jgi:putative nucleotidyltransferase with HDIG domain
LEIIESQPVSVAVLDVLIPGIDGLTLLKKIKRMKPFSEVIMISGAADIALAIEAMRYGARDYVLKPFNLGALAASVRRSFQYRHRIMESKEYQDHLEMKIREKATELIEQNMQLQLLVINTVQSLVYTLEAKDKHTEGHSKRVALLAILLAKRLGYSDEEVEKLRLAGILHDIGKIGVREACLNKAGTLNDEEYDEIKEHPLISERILKPIEELREIIPHIKHHHERYDGRGYPCGLQGTEIPVDARILAMADSYDAMTTNRPYRSALSADEAMEEMKLNAGRQFDPQLVSVFVEMRKHVEAVMKSNVDEPSAELSFLPKSPLLLGS